MLHVNKERVKTMSLLDIGNKLVERVIKFINGCNKALIGEGVCSLVPCPHPGKYPAPLLLSKLTLFTEEFL